MPLIHRITLFKIPGVDKQKQLLAAYEKVAKSSTKASPTYLLTFSLPYSTPRLPPLAHRTSYPF